MSDTGNKNTLAPTIEDKDVYKTAIDTRNFEISLFWQRSNYFLVLNTALAVGFFKLEPRALALVIAIFGFVVSILWFGVNLGSKYWQSRWEQRLKVTESQIAPGLKFFAADRNTTDADVQESIRSSEHRYCFQKWLDELVMMKPSVSCIMLLLSFSFILAWACGVAVKLLSGGPWFG